jgi:hypothetical protein
LVASIVVGPTNVMSTAVLKLLQNFMLFPRTVRISVWYRATCSTYTVLDDATVRAPPLVHLFILLEPIASIDHGILCCSRVPRSRSTLIDIGQWLRNTISDSF